MFTNTAYDRAPIIERVQLHDQRANDFADAAIRASSHGETGRADILAAANLQAFAWALALESEHAL